MVCLLLTTGIADLDTQVQLTKTHLGLARFSVVWHVFVIEFRYIKFLQ